MTPTWYDDDIHKLVLAEASELWRKSQRNSLWFRILNRSFGSPRPDALYIQEFAGADWTSGACTGELAGTWVLDQQGFRASSPPPLDPVSHQHFERLTFHSSPDLARAALTHYYSPYGGFGHIMQLDTRRGRPRLTPTKSWIF